MASAPSTTPPTSPDARFEFPPAPKLKEVLEAVESSADDSDAEDCVQPREKLASAMQSRESDVPECVGDNLAHSDASPSNDGSTFNFGVADAAVADDGETNAIQSRGRLSSRVHVGVKQSEELAMNSPKAPSGNTLVVERPSREADDIERADGGTGDEEQDDDVLVRSKMLLRRRRRTRTPQTSISMPNNEALSGLLVTPSNSPPSAQPSSRAEHSGSDDEVPARQGDRPKAVVPKKRMKRLVREAEEACKKEHRAAAAEEAGDNDEDHVSDITDDEGGRRLTQTHKSKARPSRKASKKALEEMNRETQRMQRAMQLAHEAKTRKKITKATLFEKFNFDPSANVSAKKQRQNSSQPPTPASMKSTDAEMEGADTPPSSPPARVEDVLGRDLKVLQSQTGAALLAAPTIGNEGHVKQDEGGEISDLLDMKHFARRPLEKGKAKATVVDPLAQNSARSAPKRQVRVKLPESQANKVNLGSDDEDENLVVLDSRKSKLDALFDYAPKDTAKVSHALLVLRQLAHLDSPERTAHKKRDKTSMTLAELQVFLKQSAREQAKKEQERRLDMLKAKGIHISTEQEREREREAVDDIVARARREAEEIMDRERAAAKKEKRASGEDDPLVWDESGSDEDYRDDYRDDGNEEQDADIELSDSEEGDTEDEAMVSSDDADDYRVGEAGAAGPGTPRETSAIEELVDDNADESLAIAAYDSEPSFVDPGEEEERHRWGVSDQDKDEAPAFVQVRRPKKPNPILSGDEDLDVEKTPKPKTRVVGRTPAPKTYCVAFTPAPTERSPKMPTSVLRSANKPFIPGLPVNAGSPAGLGLTQIFAGTMESQTAPLEGSPSQLMPNFDNFPSSPIPQDLPDAEANLVLDSQLDPASRQVLVQDGTRAPPIPLDFKQSQTHGMASFLRNDVMTQASDIVNPTQDAGFQGWTPLRERFVELPPASVETVVRDLEQLEDMSHESPLLQKRARLRRKVVVVDSGSEETGDPTAIQHNNAFNAMKDAAARDLKRQARKDFDKRKTKAREMVEEQAEESEDEYAGLGGVDGEDSDDDDAASLDGMIDDQGPSGKEDETKLAAFFADRARADDEREVNKLFKELTTGMLRRKRRAGDYGLSDSDDGGEARRRMKRRQFAKMQKALFANECISKVAENPRNQAFMRTIQDIASDEDEEMDFLLTPPSPHAEDDSQKGLQNGRAQPVVSDRQPAGAGADAGAGAGAGAGAVGVMGGPAKRAPAVDRRRKNGKKPCNIGEVREALSRLLHEPGEDSVVSVVSVTEAGPESSEDKNQESESSNKENVNPPRSRRGPVVDRIHLKRQTLSKASASCSAIRMAFAAPNSANGSGRLDVPPPVLLRRTTTNLLMGSAGPNSSERNAASAGGFGEEIKIKKTTGKRSGISYLARENDRRKALDEAERRRERRNFRAVKGRSKIVGDLLGSGKFE